MQQDNKQPESLPLYKRLNQEREKGFFEVKSFLISNDIVLKKENGDIAYLGVSFPLTKIADAQYTALAVNNLHILAEALERLIIDIEMNYRTEFILSSTHDKLKTAKEAIKSISQ